MKTELIQPETVCKNGGCQSSPKVKPNDLGQTKKSNYSSCKLFKKMVSVILCISYHGGVYSSIFFFFYHLSFNQLFDAAKMRRNIIIDS